MEVALLISICNSLDDKKLFDAFTELQIFIDRIKASKRSCIYVNKSNQIIWWCFPLANRKKGRKEFQWEASKSFQMTSDGATRFNVTMR